MAYYHERDTIDPERPNAPPAEVADGDVLVFVASGDGPPLPVPVAAGATADGLKRAVAGAGGPPAAAQRLSFAGAELRGDATLADAGVGAQARVELAVRPPEPKRAPFKQFTYETMFNPNKADHEKIRATACDPVIARQGERVVFSVEILCQTWGPTCITQYCVGIRDGAGQEGEVTQKAALYTGCPSRSLLRGGWWRPLTCHFDTRSLAPGVYDVLWTQQMQYTVEAAFRNFGGRSPVIANFEVLPAH